MTSGPLPAALNERGPWQNTIGADLPLDLEAVFPEVHGFFVKRANDRRAKLLLQLKPTILKALAPGEQVRFACRGVRYEVGEFMFSGRVAAVQSNQLALVLTDQRLLLIYVDSRGAPRDIKNQVRLTELRGAKKHGLGGQLRLELADGKHLDFTGVPKADRKILETRLPVPPKGQQAPKSPGPSLEHLCPRCLKVVPGIAGDVRACPHPECRIPFRSAKTAALLSLSVPGIGDMYLRHFFFGAFEYLGSLLVLGISAFFIMVALSARTQESWVTAGIVAALLIIGPRIIDYAITLHMGHKGLVPLTNTPAGSAATGLAPRASEPVIPSFPVWAYALLVGGALILVAGLTAAYPAAVSQGILGRATAAAEAGRFEQAHALWLKAEANDTLDANDRARLARDLFSAGDLTGGNEVLAKVGDAQVDAEVAKEIDSFLTRLATANKDYDAGVTALVGGQEATAWPVLDRALATYGTIKRPALPATHDGVLVRVACELLSAPLARADLEQAKQYAAKAGKDLPAGEARAVQARIAAAEGRPQEATTLLVGVGLPSLSLGAQLLALETRVAVDRSSANFRQVAKDARALPAASLTDSMLARRAALMAVGGDVSGLEPAIVDRAAEIAQAEGWKEAVLKLRSAAPRGERP